jgi:hypothetical protein
VAAVVLDWVVTRSEKKKRKKKTKLNLWMGSSAACRACTGGRGLCVSRGVLSRCAVEWAAFEGKRGRGAGGALQDEAWHAGTSFMYWKGVVRGPWCGSGVRERQTVESQ